MTYQIQNHLGIPFNQNFEQDEECVYEDEMEAVRARDWMNQQVGRGAFEVVEVVK